MKRSRATKSRAAKGTSNPVKVTRFEILNCSFTGKEDSRLQSIDAFERIDFQHETNLARLKRGDIDCNEFAPFTILKFIGTRSNVDGSTDYCGLLTASWQNFKDINELYDLLETFDDLLAGNFEQHLKSDDALWQLDDLREGEIVDDNNEAIFAPDYIIDKGKDERGEFWYYTVWEPIWFSEKYVTEHYRQYLDEYLRQETKRHYPLQVAHRQAQTQQQQANGEDRQCGEMTKREKTATGDGPQGRQGDRVEGNVAAKRKDKNESELKHGPIKSNKRSKWSAAAKQLDGVKCTDSATEMLSSTTTSISSAASSGSAHKSNKCIELVPIKASIDKSTKPPKTVKSNLAKNNPVDSRSAQKSSAWQSKPTKEATSIRPKCSASNVAHRLKANVETSKTSAQQVEVVGSILKHLDVLHGKPKKQKWGYKESIERLNETPKTAKEAYKAKGAIDNIYQSHKSADKLSAKWHSSHSHVSQSANTYRPLLKTAAALANRNPTSQWAFSGGNANQVPPVAQSSTSPFLSSFSSISTSNILATPVTCLGRNTNVLPDSAASIFANAPNLNFSQYQNASSPNQCFNVNGFGYQSQSTLNLYHQVNLNTTYGDAPNDFNSANSYSTNSLQEQSFLSQDIFNKQCSASQSTHLMSSPGFSYHSPESQRDSHDSHYRSRHDDGHSNWSGRHSSHRESSKYRHSDFRRENSSHRKHERSHSKSHRSRRSKSPKRHHHKHRHKKSSVERSRKHSKHHH